MDINPRAGTRPETPPAEQNRPQKVRGIEGRTMGQVGRTFPWTRLTKLFCAKCARCRKNHQSALAFMEGFKNVVILLNIEQDLAKLTIPVFEAGLFRSLHAMQQGWRK